ncbi:SDR family NAD(P)-dependent oxidoreductase [Streptomyces sp. L7]
MTLPLEGLVAIVTGARTRTRPGRGARTRPAWRGRGRQRLRPAGPGRLRRGLRGAPPNGSPPRSARRASRAVAHTGDVADSQQASQLVELALDELGGLDILVNNAGILRDRMVFSMTEGEWDSVIRVHLKGHFNIDPLRVRALAPAVRETGAPVYGRIVNTSSEAFLAGSAGQPNYAAAKGGIVGLTTSTALALAKYGVTRERHLPARPHPHDRGRLRRFPGARRGPRTRWPPSMSPRSSATWPHLPPHGSTDSCSSCTAAWSRSSNARMCRAKFDSKQDTFTYDELDAVLTPHYARRPAEEDVRGGRGARGSNRRAGRNVGNARRPRPSEDGRGRVVQGA